jgi:3-oxoacyl-[acyl-carrier protein] reductase
MMAAKLAIVTGAGSGIGLAVARRLARDSYAVAVNDLLPERADMAAASIASEGGTAIAIAGDVAREEDVAALVQGAERAFGGCTLLVNNAGHVHQASFVDLEPADFDRMFAVHVRGTYLCTRAVLPGMLARRTGAIVNMASQLGQIGGVELVHYSAAKAAIIGMTKALAREVSAKGLRVNAVAPGRCRRRGGRRRRPGCRSAASASRTRWPKPSLSWHRRKRACSSARRSGRIPAM